MCFCCGYAFRIYIIAFFVFLQLIPHFLLVMIAWNVLECRIVPSESNSLEVKFMYVLYFQKKGCMKLNNNSFPPWLPWFPTFPTLKSGCTNCSTDSIEVGGGGGGGDGTLGIGTLGIGSVGIKGSMGVGGTLVVTVGVGGSLGIGVGGSLDIGVGGGSVEVTAGVGVNFTIPLKKYKFKKLKNPRTKRKKIARILTSNVLTTSGKYLTYYATPNTKTLKMAPEDEKFGNAAEIQTMEEIATFSNEFQPRSQNLVSENEKGPILNFFDRVIDIFNPQKITPQKFFEKKFDILSNKIVDPFWDEIFEGPKKMPKSKKLQKDNLTPQMRKKTTVFYNFESLFAPVQKEKFEERSTKVQKAQDMEKTEKFFDKWTSGTKNSEAATFLDLKVMAPSKVLKPVPLRDRLIQNLGNLAKKLKLTTKTTPEDDSTLKILGNFGWRALNLGPEKPIKTYTLGPFKPVIQNFWENFPKKIRKRDFEFLRLEPESPLLTDDQKFVTKNPFLTSEMGPLRPNVEKFITDLKQGLDHHLNEFFFTTSKNFVPQKFFEIDGKYVRVPEGPPFENSKKLSNPKIEKIIKKIDKARHFVEDTILKKNVTRIQNPDKFFEINGQFGWVTGIQNVQKRPKISKKGSLEILKNGSPAENVFWITKTPYLEKGPKISKTERQFSKNFPYIFLKNGTPRTTRSPNFDQWGKHWKKYASQRSKEDTLKILEKLLEDSKVVPNSKMDTSTITVDPIKNLKNALADHKMKKMKTDPNFENQKWERQRSLRKNKKKNRKRPLEKNSKNGPLEGNLKNSPIEPLENNYGNDLNGPIEENFENGPSGPLEKKLKNSSGDPSENQKNDLWLILNENSRIEKPLQENFWEPLEKSNDPLISGKILNFDELEKNIEILTMIPIPLPPPENYKKSEAPDFENMLHILGKSPLEIFWSRKFRDNGFPNSQNVNLSNENWFAKNYPLVPMENVLENWKSETTLDPKLVKISLEIEESREKLRELEEIWSELQRRKNPEVPDFYFGISSTDKSELILDPLDISKEKIENLTDLDWQEAVINKRFLIPDYKKIVELEKEQTNITNYLNKLKKGEPMSFTKYSWETAPSGSDTYEKNYWPLKKFRENYKNFYNQSYKKDLATFKYERKWKTRKYDYFDETSRKIQITTEDTNEITYTNSEKNASPAPRLKLPKPLNSFIPGMPTLPAWVPSIDFPKNPMEAINLLIRLIKDNMINIEYPDQSPFWEIMYEIVWTYIILDILWFITTIILIRGARCCVRGCSAMCYYIPWIVVTLALISMDLAGFFICLPHVHSGMYLLRWFRIAGVKDIETVEKLAWQIPQSKYKKAHAWGPVAMCAFFLRGGFFFILNCIFVYIVIKILKCVILTRVVEKCIVHPCNYGFRTCNVVPDNFLPDFRSKGDYSRKEKKAYRTQNYPFFYKSNTLGFGDSQKMPQNVYQSAAFSRAQSMPNFYSQWYPNQMYQGSSNMYQSMPNLQTYNQNQKPSIRRSLYDYFFPKKLGELNSGYGNVPTNSRGLGDANLTSSLSSTTILGRLANRLINYI